MSGMMQTHDYLFEELRTRKAESSLSPEGFKLAEKLSHFRLEDLKHMHYALAESDLKNPKKADLAIAIARLVAWKDAEAFGSFFSTLPPALQDALTQGTFSQFVDVKRLETTYHIKIIKANDGYSYSFEHQFVPKSRFGFFLIYDGSTLRLPPLLMDVFARYMPKPARYDAIPMQTPPAAACTMEHAVFETMPLAIDALAAKLNSYGRGDIPRKGLLKAELKACRAASGFGMFSVASRLGLDAMELFARFIACFVPGTIARPAEPDKFIQTAVQRFLRCKYVAGTMTGYEGSSFEMWSLTDHLQRKPGTEFIPSTQVPSRQCFLEALNTAAKSGGWYDANDVIESIRLHGQFFAFASEQDEYYSLRIKADAMTLDGVEYEPDMYDDYIEPSPPIRDRLVAVPLFKAYCYLMAALGVLEIAETEPPLVLERGGKMLPISPYDGLSAFRVTNFGAWCLGLSEERPTAPKQRFEAIIDDELPIVTFKGQSLERKLFLESIGTKLGDERYRVTETSFSSGCKSVADIESRVLNFKRLLADDPPELWQRIFTKAVTKARALVRPRNAYVFQLPPDQDFRREFLAYRALDGLYIKGEGGVIIVMEKDYPKFMKAAEALGFMVPRLG